MNEFADTYSDDLIYLKEGREALLTHPLKRELKFLCDASYCRMLAIMMVGSIEMMISNWRERDKLSILEKWFAEKTSNGNRVRSLYDAFCQAGIPVDEEVFSDFLAVKYLRNAIVHSRWLPGEVGWVTERGFPTDTRELSETHWRKMLAVNDNMMWYIALTSVHPDREKLTQGRGLLPKIRVPESTSPEPTGIVRERDLPTIFWQNLDRISEFLWEAVREAASTEEYNWARGLDQEAIDGVSGLQRQVLIYASARKAGEQGLEVLTRLKDFGEDALYSWREYQRLTFAKLGVTKVAVIEALETMRSLYERGIYFHGPWFRNVRAEAACHLVEHVLKGYEPLRTEQVVMALNLGALLHDEIMPNAGPARVFNVLLPIVDPLNTQVYLDAGDDAMTAAELGMSWYSYIEYRRPLTAENLAVYKQFRALIS